MWFQNRRAKWRKCEKNVSEAEGKVEEQSNEDSNTKISLSESQESSKSSSHTPMTSAVDILKTATSSTSSSPAAQPIPNDVPLFPITTFPSIPGVLPQTSTELSSFPPFYPLFTSFFIPQILQFPHVTHEYSSQTRQRYFPGFHQTIEPGNACLTNSQLCPPLR